ncbi:MAG: hypothetical protein K2L95_04720 [Alphaproteobacteria bacterium]|nr:hypothetical protein [Alphaproteobacteria bacterium]
MFKNKFGALISHPLVRQIEQDINKTKDKWETQEAQNFLSLIFGSYNPEDFEHLIFDKKPTRYNIEQMLRCDNLPYNYGNKTQYYMKWLVCQITMPNNVDSFNHVQLQGLINLQTLYHLGSQYKTRYFQEPYGTNDMQSVGCWMLDGFCMVNPDDAKIKTGKNILTYKPYNYVAIVHDAWRDKDIDMFRIQLPDMKNNQFYRQHFFVAVAHNNNQVCGHGLSESLAKQALMERIKAQLGR